MRYPGRRRRAWRARGRVKRIMGRAGLVRRGVMMVAMVVMAMMMVMVRWSRNLVI